MNKLCPHSQAAIEQDLLEEEKEEEIEAL